MSNFSATVAGQTFEQKQDAKGRTLSYIDGIRVAKDRYVLDLSQAQTVEYNRAKRIAQQQAQLALAADNAERDEALAQIEVQIAEKAAQKPAQAVLLLAAPVAPEPVADKPYEAQARRIVSASLDKGEALDAAEVEAVRVQLVRNATLDAGLLDKAAPAQGKAKAAKAEKPAAPRVSRSPNADRRIVVNPALQGKNPRRENSHGFFAYRIYGRVSTYGEYLLAGGGSNHFDYDRENGYAAFEGEAFAPLQGRIAAAIVSGK